MFSLTPTLRALTSGSPITTALHEARRMARRHLETGGATVFADRRSKIPGFLVPADVDAVVLESAIAAELRAGGNAGSGRSSGLQNLLDETQNGRFVVPRAVLERLGSGNMARGEQLIGDLMSKMRSRHILAGSRPRQR